jgi:H+/gluconate symporter-like permease
MRKYYSQKRLLPLIIIILVTILLLSHKVYAIDNPIGANTTITNVIDHIVNFAIQLVTPLSALMILIAGFLYMTGGGNPEKIKTAHKVLIWALVGIAVVLLAKSAILIVKDVLKVQ